MLIRRVLKYYGSVSTRWYLDDIEHWYRCSSTSTLALALKLGYDGSEYRAVLEHGRAACVSISCLLNLVPVPLLVGER
jgi:hypothetical protein